MIEELIKKPMLNSGIYNVGDIATILNLPLYKVRRWLKVYWDNILIPGQRYTWGEGRNKTTSFYTLIEFYIFYKLREIGLSFNTIINSHFILSEIHQSPYPFALNKVLTDGKMIYHIISGDLLQADIKRQFVFKELIDAYLLKLDFNTHEIAERYWPLGKEHNVVIDPKHQFGQPILNGTNILVETIYRIYKNGEDEKTILSMYDITEDNLKDVVSFYRKVV